MSRRPFSFVSTSNTPKAGPPARPSVLGAPLGSTRPAGAALRATPPGRARRRPIATFLARAVDDPKTQRTARGAAALAWWGLAACLARSVVRTRDVGPEHLIAVLTLGYLAAWGPYFLFARRSPVGKTVRLAACTASVVLGFVLVELPAVVHVVDYRSIFRTPTPPWKRAGNAPDAGLLYVREPNQRLRLRFLGADLDRLEGVPAPRLYQCDAWLDGAGFRNPEGLDSARVVIIGDSFVEGLQAADDDLISSRLGGALGVHVANLGRTGYGPQQELEVLRRHGPRFEPRTCVWAFYEGNDLQDVDAYDASRDQVGALRPESPARAWFGRSFVRNASAFLVRRGGRAPKLPARLRTGEFRDAHGRSTPIYFSCGVHEGEAEAAAGRCESPAMRRFQTIMADAASLCRARGVDLVVAFVPSKFRVYRDFCRFAPDSPCLDWPVDALPEAVESAVRAAGGDVGFLDLTPELQDHAARGELVYLADDTHWSAQGHRAAALAIADFLRRRDPARSVTEARRPDRRDTSDRLSGR